jgi:hypothetical protein
MNKLHEDYHEAIFLFVFYDEEGIRKKLGDFYVV